MDSAPVTGMPLGYCAWGAPKILVPSSEVILTVHLLHEINVLQR